jgi:hypothetical protein
MLEMKNGGKFSLIMNAQSRDDENDRMAPGQKHRDERR